MLQLLAPFFKQHRLDAFLITEPFTVRHLTGFTGTNGMAFITKKQNFFITDFRYQTQAKKQVADFSVVIADRSLNARLTEILKKQGAVRLGFQSTHISYEVWRRYKKILPNIRLIPIANYPSELRTVKTTREIKNIERALAIHKIAFRKTRRFIKPGVSEVAVARRLEQALLSAGAEKIGFDTIIASGIRGALPHGVASNKKLKRGELVTIDFGCVVNGYHSDETVTVCLGEPTVKQSRIWRIVYEAQQAAVKIARPGTPCAKLDAAARGYITRAGYGKYFGHALGHGVGLEIHERPTLSEKSPDILEPGMVFTIEPGIYIPGWGGVRIEDVYACTKTGVKQISQIHKKL